MSEDVEAKVAGLQEAVEKSKQDSKAKFDRLGTTIDKLGTSLEEKMNKLESTMVDDRGKAQEVNNGIIELCRTLKDELRTMEEDLKDVQKEVVRDLSKGNGTDGEAAPKKSMREQQELHA